MQKKLLSNFKINDPLIARIANIVTIAGGIGIFSAIAYFSTLIPQPPKPKDLLVVGQQLQLQDFDVISKRYSFWSQDALGLVQDITTKNTLNISKDNLANSKEYSRYFNEEINQVNFPSLIDKIVMDKKSGKIYRYFVIRFIISNQSNKKITNIKLPFSPPKDGVLVMERYIEGELLNEEKEKFYEAFKKEYLSNNVPIVNLPEIKPSSSVVITFTLAEPELGSDASGSTIMRDYLNVAGSSLQVENATYTYKKINFFTPQFSLPQPNQLTYCSETSSDISIPRDCSKENDLPFFSFYSIFSPFSPFSTLIRLIGFLLLIVISIFILRSVITTKRVLQQSIKQDLPHKLLQLAIKRTLENKHSEALLLLQQAISEGLDKETLKNNPDLTALHAESEYKKLFEDPNP